MKKESSDDFQSCVVWCRRFLKFKTEIVMRTMNVVILEFLISSVPAPLSESGGHCEFSPVAGRSASQ